MRRRNEIAPACEIWIVDLGMAAKTRPAVVVSLAVTDNDRAMVIIEPRTTSVQGTRFEVPVPMNYLKEGAFDCQNLLTIPRAKFLRRLGSLKAGEMAEIETAVRRWLGLEPLLIANT